MLVGGEGVCVCRRGGGSVHVLPSGAGSLACVPCDTDVALCCSIAGLVDVLLDVFVLSSVVRLKKLCCRA